MLLSIDPTSPRRILRLLPILIPLLLGLSCDRDPGSSTAGNGEVVDPTGNGSDPNDTRFCVQIDDCAFGEVCIAGVCSAYTDTQKPERRCVADTDCASTERCATWSGVCVEVANTQPPGLREGDVCLDDDRRTCGTSKVGVCRLGYQLCVDGQWSEDCIGNRDPAPEVCDGRDNDCDGVIDNTEPADASCDDDDPCTGSPRCERGRCVAGTPVDCTGLDSVCTVGQCNSADGSCDSVNLPDGQTCDDGDLCSVGSTCDDGSCTGATPKSCAHLDTECMVGVCDPATGGCQAVPRENDIACDDGNLCTLLTTCQEGVCTGGEPVDCSGETDECNRGVCDGETGQCTTTPRREGQSCDDGMFCTVGTVCSAGTCGGGTTRDCGAAGDECNTGVCDESAGECVPEPANEGDECDDGLYCTVSTQCVAGQCLGEDRTCPGDVCNAGLCDETDRRCVLDAFEDETPCDDGNLCTSDSVCQAGSCGGGDLLDCSGETDECNRGICDPDSGLCTTTPRREGQSCDDGAFCTVETICELGTCGGGTPRSCTSEGDQCNAGVCDPSEGDSGACVKEPYADDRSCQDGLFCTVGTTCQADGSCGGGSERNCSGEGGSCRTGVCDEEAGECTGEPVEDGTECQDGLYCTVDTECLAGECVGSPRDCSQEADQCNVGACDELGGRCVPEPANQGEDCEDGLFCTVNTVCDGGACVGAPRDCDEAADACNEGICDEATDACIPEPANEGDTCDDGLWCTVSDRCVSGTCTGQPRNCGAAGDQCNDGVCDEDAEECVAEPANEGQSCDDGDWCTENDSCFEGSCLGAARDCSGESDQCNVGVCDSVDRRCVAEPTNEGDPCEDGLYCTVNTLCTAGTCSGTPRDCSIASDQCNEGICDEAADDCVPDPVVNNTACDDGLWCTVNDRCTDGICSGQARDCSGASDQCNDGVCDEADDACVPEPVADGTACDDGAWCTVDDACTAGVCSGAPRNCDDAGDQCNEGVCNESQDRCDPLPVADGTECTDGNWCSIDEACYGGSCLGAPRNCDSAAPNDCFDGVCSEEFEQCIAVDNESCPNMPPVADCSVSDDTPFPLDTVVLDGSGSSDPDGDTLVYTWEVVERPDGSTSQPASPNSATSDFFVDLAGQYTIRLTVSDGEYSDTCYVTLDVVPPQDLHVELVWQEDSGDLDLHMTRYDESPLGAFFDNSAAQLACWFMNCTGGGVNWGASLDIDARAGSGPENINIFQDPNNGRYYVGVHNFCDQSTEGNDGIGPRTLHARVRVYCSGQLVAQWPSSSTWRALEQPGDFWLAGYVDWTGAGATGCNTTSVDDSSKPGATYAVAAGFRSSTQPDLHCKGGSTCNDHADCRDFESCFCLNPGCNNRECRLSHTCTANGDCNATNYPGGCDTDIGFCVR